MTGVDISPAVAMRAIAAHSAGRAALIYEDRPVSFAELAAASAKLAGLLAHNGIGRGDRVAYLGLNSPAFFTSCLASAWLGAVFVPINHRLTVLEVRQILVDSQAAAIVVEAGHHVIAEEATAGLSPRRLLVDDDPCDRREVAAGPAWTRLGAALVQVEPAGEPVACREADLALLLYTSGTTGTPKGVALSHGNLWWNHVNLDGAAGMRCDDVNLVVAPLFHIAPFACFTARALMRGATSVIRRTFDVSRVLADLVEYRVTTLWAVPAMLRAISRVPGFATADLSRLAVVVSSGAPAPRPVLAEYLERGIAVQQGYGLTEVGFATCVPAANVRATLGSVGVALPFTEIRIAAEGDDPGGDLREDRRAAGTTGEVWVRGPTVMSGYWQNAGATALVMRPDGWFRTGDLGYLDAERNLFLVDRKKDMIIVGGDNVFSAEVERILEDHPAIAEVAVVGVGDEIWGEVVVAAVTLHDAAATLTLSELRTFAAPHLATYKLPARLEVLTALPRNVMGKVDKKVLRGALAVRPGQEAVGAVASPVAASPVAASSPVPARASARGQGDPVDTAASWASRLAPRSPDERQRVVVDLVRGALSGMFPHVAAAAIVEKTLLFDLGLGSLAAAELVSRLGIETGLRLATSIVFEHPTVGALARYLCVQLDPVRTPVPAPTSDAVDEATPLVSQLMKLWQLREFALLMELRDASARARHVLEAKAPSARPVPSAYPIQLADSTSRLPSLLCVSPIPPFGPLFIYAALAACLPEPRRVWGLARPGYAPGEFLPHDRAELVAIHTEHVKQITAGTPFVLLGMSSGGLIAHALTSHLERIGLPPTALVLIDTYLPDDGTPAMLSAFFEGVMSFPLPRTDNEFTAWAWYFIALFADWTPAPIATPTLFLRCMDPAPGVEHEKLPGSGDWRASWKEAHTIVDVPGNHINVTMKHAATTARAIHDWLAALPVADRVTRTEPGHSPDETGAP
jgi:fatty-acyl-CoA synthase